MANPPRKHRTSQAGLVLWFEKFGFFNFKDSQNIKRVYGIPEFQSNITQPNVPIEEVSLVPCILVSIVVTKIYFLKPASCRGVIVAWSNSCK